MAAERDGESTKHERDLSEVVALMRRALIRLNTVEQRLAALEERQHDLDDMAEQIRGMQSLLKRQQGAAQDRLTSRLERFVEDKVRERMNKELDIKIAGRIESRLAKLLPGDG